MTFPDLLEKAVGIRHFVYRNPSGRNTGRANIRQRRIHGRQWHQRRGKQRSATAAAANLSAIGQITPELAGTAAVIASMASALTNLPLVFKHLPGPVLLRIASSTALQIVAGAVVLAVQHYLPLLR